MPGKDIMPSLEELQQLIMNGDENFLREMLTKMLNLMMELEVSSQNGAGKYERTSERKSYRNGTRQRKLASGM